jgi:hypothetical protein
VSESFRAGAAGSAEERIAPTRAWRGRALDDKEAAATRRARRWALVLMTGSSVAAIALLASALLLLRHFF